MFSLFLIYRTSVFLFSHSSSRSSTLNNEWRYLNYWQSHFFCTEWMSDFLHWRWRTRRCGLYQTVWGKGGGSVCCILAGQLSFIFNWKLKKKKCLYAQEKCNPVCLLGFFCFIFFSVRECVWFTRGVGTAVRLLFFFFCLFYLNK